MRALFYDTETSGLPLFKEPSEHPAQPHIVQLAALLVDIDERDWSAKQIAGFDVIVRPDGWTIPPDVSAIHGISQECAMDVGVSESMALGMLLELWGESRAEPVLRIGHNEQFDARIVRIALMRYEDEPLADRWKAAPAQCTQRLAQPIMNLPPTEKMIKAGFRHAKSPNLAEAFKHFTGAELVGAHSAAADAHACLAVYLGAQRRMHVSQQTIPA